MIPAQDYTKHPHITRHHHLFENFDDRFKVTVLNVRLRTGPRTRESKHEIAEVGLSTHTILRSYIVGYVSFHLKLVQLVRAQKYDCVVLSNLISPLVPLLVRGRPLIFDYKDVYPLSASEPFKAPTRQIVYWIARFFERILFKFHMTVVVPSPSMQRMVRNRFKIESVLISNGVNTELFHPISERSRQRIRSELGIQEKEFALCYLGSIENWLDLETVVETLIKVKPLKLVLIGDPPRSATYLRKVLLLCERRNVRERVIRIGFKPQAEAARILAACDAAIMPFSLRNELSALALPDKVFEYLASGRPVISTQIPDVEALFGDYIHFYKTKEELSATLKSLRSRTERKSSSRSQIEVASEYDWKILSKAYEQLIIQLAENTRRNS